MRIRNFVYLDLERALDWLAQLQRGLYRELQLEVTDKIGKQTGFDAKAQLPVVDVGLGFQRGGSSEESKTLRAVVDEVAPSYVARLFDQLEEQGSLQRLDDLDEKRWAGLQRGAIIETQATIDVRSYLWREGGFLLFTNPPKDENERNARSALRALEDRSPVWAIAQLSKDKRFKLMFALDRANLSTDEGALNNDYELLAQVERKFGAEGKLSRLHPFINLTPIALVNPVAIY